MRTVEASILINTPSPNIIAAFTDQKLLSAWWDVENSLIEPRINGSYTLTWGVTKDGIKYVMSGVIIDFNPENLLHVGHLVYISTERPILGPMELIVSVTQSNAQSVVRACQKGYRSGEHWDWYYEAVKSAWPVVLQNLKNFMEKDKT